MERFVLANFVKWIDKQRVPRPRYSIESVIGATPLSLSARLLTNRLFENNLENPHEEWH